MIDSMPDKTLSDTVVSVKNLNISYGNTSVIKDLSINFPEKQVTAIIGPSGCGKSTLLRTLNRMNDFIVDTKIYGEVIYRGQNLYDRDMDPVSIRREIGMVFQEPNPFVKSIYENIAWGPRLYGVSRTEIKERVHNSLKDCALWREVYDRLDTPAFNLSRGQQQRLCLARTLAMEPHVILMDEPCSALDPVATARIEDLILELRDRYTIIIVTHNMQQARRVSDFTLFMENGERVEFGRTPQMFSAPTSNRTEDYVNGRFG